MLILFSDVHLTDGSSSETINEEAFDRFADQVVDLVRRRSPEEVRLVLLGDGLDLVRSDLWLNREGIRPWSRPGPQQERLVLDIVRRTISTNRWAIDHLLDIPARIALAGHLPPGPIRLDYCLGNHDWLINRYRSARALVAERFRLDGAYASSGFPLVYRSAPDHYDVVARHGDVHDRINCAAGGKQEAPSLGDAIIVELLSRFPREVGRELGSGPAVEDAVRRLKEIDNVRPMTHLAAWVLETISELGRGNPRFLGAVDRALERVVGEFRRNGAVQELAEAQLTWLQRWYLRAVLADVRRRKGNVLNSWPRLADRAVRFWHLVRNLPASKYAAHALGERGTDGRPPRFVVYGHSHRPESVPLGPSARDGRDRFYLNTGTWRTVWQMAETGGLEEHFACWKEMSYVVLYAPNEAGGRHEFEIWTGGLRDRPADPPRVPVPQETPGPGHEYRCQASAMAVPSLCSSGVSRVRIGKPGRRAEGRHCRAAGPGRTGCRRDRGGAGHRPGHRPGPGRGGGPRGGRRTDA